MIVHGGYALGERILDFVSAYELVIVNTYFRKSKEHYIIYKGRGTKSQIYYFMLKGGDLK